MHGQKELLSGLQSSSSVGLVSGLPLPGDHLASCKNIRCIVIHSGAGNDYQKDLQFRKLNEKKDQLEVKMRRGGDQVLVPNQEIVVGDVIILQTGDKITADGIIIESNNMVVDEASLTGESEPIKKGVKDPFCRAGTTVSHQSATGTVPGKDAYVNTCFLPETK